MAKLILVNRFREFQYLGAKGLTGIDKLAALVLVAAATVGNGPTVLKHGWHPLFELRVR